MKNACSTRTLVLAVLLFTTLAVHGVDQIPMLAETANPDADNESVVKADAVMSLSGKLKGGMAGIGGEHTGWVLEYQTKAGPQTLEVDCSGLEAASVHAGAVRIMGRVFKRNYLERGPTLILKATKIERLPTAASKSDTQAVRHPGTADDNNPHHRSA